MSSPGGSSVPSVTASGSWPSDVRSSISDIAVPPGVRRSPSRYPGTAPATGAYIVAPATPLPAGPLPQASSPGAARAEKDEPRGTTDPGGAVSDVPEPDQPEERHDADRGPHREVAGPEHRCRHHTAATTSQDQAVQQHDWRHGGKHHRDHHGDP